MSSWDRDWVNCSACMRACSVTAYSMALTFQNFLSAHFYVSCHLISHMCLSEMLQFETLLLKQLQKQQNRDEFCDTVLHTQGGTTHH